MTNLNNQDSFINMCKKLSTEILGPNAFKDQESVMDKGMELPNDKKLHDTLEQYAIINKNMQLLGEESKFFNEVRMRQTWWRHCKQQEGECSCNG